ncbi:HAMP domain-containing protein [Clostridium sp. D2Q-11]|uniref:histidine kinase n=1 Tax=Anaeromonas frigoriresistens TaxID=2683708 RepID=A0A942V1X8_9FIRM|nr:ATP-binding protein [Anaeromonas frigoriresistens]MBS4538502.1 HAMP domain-containing protein [Anaeromonas frigoriresistens]
MFKSIRIKFITVYFLLVFIAMIIAGIFIVTVFEKNQLKQVESSMKAQAQSILAFSPTIKEGSWDKLGDEEKSDLLTKSPIYTTDNRVYIVDTTKVSPEIISTNIGQEERLIGESAYNIPQISPTLIVEASNGNEIFEYNEEMTLRDLAYPIKNEEGEVRGVIYIIYDLKNINDTISETKTIFIEATLLALAITVILGFMIASSITEPIKDVTVKAEKMAEGDFKQYVDVKSDDEIGQLASMFNLLTRKLDTTISEIFREKSKMETIFNYMADGVIAVDIKGRISHANPIAKNILKVKGEDLKNKDYDEIISSVNKYLTLKNIIQNEDLKGKQMIETETSTYMARFAPYLNEGDEFGGIIIVFQDITEQQNLDNLRREFVANVSHELKTPITTIKSYTETLLDGALESKDLSIQFLGVVNDECDRMSRIVRDLLQLSNFDNKEVKWEKEFISLSDLLLKSYTKLEISIKEKKQEIKIDVDDNVPLVYADKDAIEQVILNILSNAIKYTPENGFIEVKGVKQSEAVKIIIEDNGIGIPKEDLERIFERFYRVDKARSRDLGGTGLGLSISKRIIESHNGKINIESEYGKGTRVNITLPIKDNLDS